MVPLRIAQIAPLAESVPPQRYGGTERVVSCLTEGLVARGHHVTLFASADSRTAATLVPCAPRALRGDPGCIDRVSRQVLQLERVFSRAAEFDVLHFHIDSLHFPLARRSGVPTITTLHGRQDLPDLVPLYDEFADIPLVSISNSQREPCPRANWLATVYHGLPARQFPFRETPGDYLAFLGRISPEKRPDLAVEIAGRAGVPIRIAAKIDPVDRAYHERLGDIFTRPGVEFVGEIGDADKAAFLAGARALLFPIDWPEPFGLVMIESLACGTPVIAFRRGSVPEIIQDGVSGFVVAGVEEAARAVARLDGISRRACREEFERRFSADRMVAEYERLYARLAAHAEAGS